MFDFGDELIFGSHRIPWLIWIQLMVMLLLIILLYYFSIFALGLDPSPNATIATPSTALESSKHRPPPTATAAPHSTALESSKHRPPATASAASSSRLLSTKAGNRHGSKGDPGTSTSRRRARGEEIQEREGNSSAKDATHASVLEHSYHPCHYLGLAKQAFLKCLGLDPPSKDSPNPRRRKEQ